jgi:cytochrome c-type biogenesis protein CcmH/NrfF
MVSYLIAGQLLTLPNWAWHTARILWMLPLILFLMAQLLLPLTRNRGGNARGNTGSSADNDG